MKKYDVVIIGAGTAGLSARKLVDQKTKNYIVIDGGTLGTTCARVGCMPSKVLIQVANDFHRRLSLAEEGINGGENLSLENDKVMAHVRKLRDRFVRGVMSSFESWSSKHLVQKYAKFTSKNKIELSDGETIEFDKAIIASGSSPVIPTPWKPFSKYFVDTNEFFEQDILPKKMAVIGLGVIGIELGQAMHRLGVDVVGIGSTSIAGISDPKLKEYTINKFSEEMTIDMTGVKELKEENGQLVVVTGTGEYKVDKALISVGRSPNLKGLNLEAITDKFSSRGMPEFNTKNFKLIDAPNISIVGDVNGIAPILHESADEGAVAGYFAVNNDDDGCFSRRTPIGVSFSSPNIAFVGKKYADLENEGIDFEVGEVSYEGQGRAIVMLSEKGLLRVYGSKKDNKLLGAELFAPSGEHMAHLIAWAISADMTVEQVLSLPFYHPVVEEGLRTALRDLMGKLSDSRSPLELARCLDLKINKP
jgi:dihydrolipoamide dehydrogenase